MAGIAAGVVGAAEVNSQPRPPRLKGMWAEPVTWSTVWFALALFYLLAVYYGMIRIKATGE